MFGGFATDMAKIFQTVVRRIARAIVSGANGFVASVVKVGVRLNTQFRLIATELRTGIASSPVISLFFTRQNPAITISAKGINGLIQFSVKPALKSVSTLRSAVSVFLKSAVKISQSLRGFSGTFQKHGLLSALKGVIGSVIVFNRPSFDASAVISDYKAKQTPAANLVQIKYDLAHRSGASSVTEAAVGGRSDFDTPANAQGRQNGTLCTCAGNALAARSGRIDLSYADFLNKQDLTIQTVRLHFYYAQVSTLAAASTGGYNFGGADTQLFSNATLSQPDFLTTPQTFDITAAIAGNWANLNTVRTYVVANIGALALNDNVRVDAVELEVLATATQIL